MCDGYLKNAIDLYFKKIFSKNVIFTRDLRTYIIKSDIMKKREKSGWPEAIGMGDDNYFHFALYFAGARRLPTAAPKHKKIRPLAVFAGWACYLWGGAGA